MDDLNPLAGTAHLLEEVDSNYFNIQFYRFINNISLNEFFREIDGTAARWSNTDWLPAQC